MVLYEDTLIYINLSTLHIHHASPTGYFGPNADEYRPDRWEKLKAGRAYIPFKSGPRICIEQRFAFAEAGSCIVRCMKELGGIESGDNRPSKEALTLI